MKRTLPAWILVTLAATLACHEPSNLDHPATLAAAREIVPRLRVSDTTDTSAVLTLSLDVGGPGGKVGSFTARVVYDSTALTFLEEVPRGDGALRALNPAAGLIRIAGASAQGIDAAALASLRFRVRDRAALALAVLEMDELHEQTRADLKRLVRPAAGTRK